MLKWRFVLVLTLIAAPCLCAAGSLWAQEQPQTRSVTELVQAVSQGDADSKSKAIDELAALGSEATPAVSALAAALADDNAGVRWRAARALAEIGPGAASALPTLVATLKDQEPLVRANAVRALGEIGEASKPVVPAIAPLLADADAAVRRATVMAFREIKPDRSVSLPLIANVLESADPSTRTLILSSLAEQGEYAVPALKEALQNPKAQYWACLVVGEIGPAAKDTVPQLLEVVKSPEVEVRHEALMALAAIGDTSAETLNAANAALADPETSVKYAAAFVLGKAGAASRQATPRLIELARSPDPFLRTIAAWSIGKANRDDATTFPKAVALLLTALKDQDKDVRMAAVEALEDLEPDASLVLPAFMEAFKDKDPVILSNIADALVQIGEPAVEPLRAAVKSPDTRRLAVNVLGRIGPSAKLAIPELVEAMRGETNKDARREIFIAMLNIGSAPPSLVPDFMKDLQSDDIQLRAGATYALGLIGPAAKEALPEIRKNLTSRDPKLRLVTVWALVHISPEDQALVLAVKPVLVAGLRHEEPMVRYEAVQTIAMLGAAMQDVVPRLKEVAESDESAEVRQAAAKAVEKLTQ